MTFTLIKGTFHLRGINKKGNYYGYEPDGDSVRFKPQNPDLLKNLKQTGKKYKLNVCGHIQLRFEAIDALEIHAEGSHQPHAESARDCLLNYLGFKNVVYSASGRRVVSVENDGQPGYILSKQLCPYGRPIAFVYSGKPKEKDGTNLWLKPERVRQSANAELLRAGQAYPLYYSTLYYDLRDALTRTVKTARRKREGIWKYDKTTKGFPVPDLKVLEEEYVIFPKLFRRIARFFKKGGTEITKFLKWLVEESGENDELTVIPKIQFIKFSNIIDVSNSGRVKLKEKPENIVFK